MAEGKAEDPEKAAEVNVKSFNEIPGPRSFPFIGSLWCYVPYIGHYSFERLHKTYEQLYHEYGPLVKERLFGSRVIVHVFNPVDMMTVYRSGRRPFRLSHRALAKYRRERPGIYKSAGLFPSNGEEWYRFRHLFQNILNSPATANNCSDALEDVTDDFISRISNLLDDKSELDIQPELFKWALECIGAITLNRRLGCLSSEGNQEAEKLVQAAHDIHETVFITENSPLYNYVKTAAYTRLVNAQDYLASVVEKYMAEPVTEHEKGHCQGSVLEAMLSVEDADYKDVFTMALDMFLAGIDTTAYTTAFALYNLAKNPDAQKKLREEVMEHLPEKSSRLSSVTESLSYLKNVIKESLRVNPVAVGTGRITPCDLVLSGYSVPAGTMVILQHQVTSLQDEHYPDARSFRPERWSKDSELKRSMSSFVSSPFGYGPRICLGMHLAQKEMFLVLGKLMRNFEVEYHYEDIDCLNRLINIPDRPVRLRLIPVDR